MIMVDKRSGEPLKKVVGKKKPQSVWLELYRLNTFADNLGLRHAADDGYPVRRIVGKPRSQRG
jgi:hypothetical protein